MSKLVDGLGPNGKLIVIGATFDPIEVTPLQLIGGSRTIYGWVAGTPADSEDTPHFAELTRVRPMFATYLWTEVCLATAGLSALDDGYEVYFVTDASAGVTKEAHEMAVQRLIQAGAVPMTWLQVMLEWQRDWARQETYDAVISVAKEHGGGYGLGINSAKTMLGEHASEGGVAKE